MQLLYSSSFNLYCLLASMMDLHRSYLAFCSPLRYQRRMQLSVHAANTTVCWAKSTYSRQDLLGLGFRCGMMISITSDYHRCHSIHSQDSGVSVDGSPQRQAQEEARTKEAEVRVQGRSASKANETTTIFQPFLLQRQIHNE